MRPLISPAVMRECEKKYFAESGVKSIAMMEKAARALADAIIERAYLTPETRVFVACGPGNNGGDGTACARLLKDCCGCNCTVVQVGMPKTPDAMENYFHARQHNIPVFTVLPDDELKDFSGEASDGAYTLPVVDAHLLPEGAPDIWIDALFGTGLSRAPEGGAKALIECINRDHEAGALVFAADIPTGLDGQMGKAFAPCVCADYTVTFQHCKTGMCLLDGLDVCGNVIVADVGFPEEAFADFDAQASEPEETLALLEKRRRNIHKGSCGHLLIVAGSFGMAGAAAMCAKAALRSGVGLVTIACPPESIPILQTLVPQAMCKPLDFTNQDSYIKYRIPSLLKGKTAVVVGCGLGVPDALLYRDESPTTYYDVSFNQVCEWDGYYDYHSAIAVLHELLNSELPVVVDADALNLIARVPALLSSLKSNHVLTPHPGEAQRLLKAHRIAARYAENKPSVYYHRLFEQETLPPELTSDPLAMSAELQKLGATVLYKGASSIIRDDKDVFISTTGCCGMARGGSGDILAGILGALLACPGKRTITQNALIASELHGLAGERAQAVYGPYAMNAADILEFLPEVFLR